MVCYGDDDMWQKRESGDLSILSTNLESVSKSSDNDTYEYFVADFIDICITELHVLHQYIYECFFNRHTSYNSCEYSNDIHMSFFINTHIVYFISTYLSASSIDMWVNSLIDMWLFIDNNYFIKYGTSSTHEFLQRYELLYRYFIDSCTFLWCKLSTSLIYLLAFLVSNSSDTWECCSLKYKKNKEWLLHIIMIGLG